MIAQLRRIIFTCVYIGCFAALCGGCLDRELKPLNPCLVSGVTRKVAVTNVDYVDLLFVVDNSGSMRQEQGSLREQFPKLISTLTTGKKSNGETFPPVKDLHLGVVSTDMGLVGIPNNYPGCNTDRHVNHGGDDGLLLHPGNAGPGCAANYPPFLSFVEGKDKPEQIATDFGCIANLGTTGCGFEMPFEAALKALWPKNYVDADGDVFPPAKNPILFLATNEEGRYGHGDTPPPAGNGGFLRNDRTKGVSLIAIIVVSDEEDCSSKSDVHFRSTNDPNDPLSKQGINLRCFYNPQDLFDVDRYIKGYQGLRPGAEQLVIFGAIVGVPSDLVSAEAREQVQFDDATARDAYYDSILADTRMQERPMNENIPSIANLAPSCTRLDKLGENSTAFPPRRSIQLAKGFGQNAIVQSICQDDFGPAMDAIIDVIAKQLGAVCLPRPLVRKSDGSVGCNVVWELPPAGAAPTQSPTACSDRPYLQNVDPGRTPVNERGGRNCKVTQLPVKTLDKVPDGDGWYYDDFTTARANECPKSQPQRVSFSDTAKPPTGVTVKLECLNETQRVSTTRTDEMPNQPQIGAACTSAKPDMTPFADDSKCVVALSNGDMDTKMFCHPELNVCVLGCTGDAQCPGGWECDKRQVSLDRTGGKAYCTNPTCGADN
ncbi:MAG TPA: hypothetical protein VJV78_33530 [Polyangiales bacterium]|nr:hypothetical protein [Polyangiales bacterium]